MGIIRDRLNTYIVRGGERFLVMPEHEIMGIDEQVVYEYTGASGVLKLNPTMIPAGTLEQMTQAIEDHKEDGIEVQLELVPIGIKRFPGVKRLESLSPEERTLPPSDIKTSGLYS